MRSRLTLAIACAATLALSLASTSAARAGITVYTNRATFLAATSGTTNIDFEGLVSPGGFQFYGGGGGGPGLTLSGVHFQSNGIDGGNLFVVDSAFFPPFYDWGSGAVLSIQQGARNSVSVTLPSGITAVGSDIMTFLPYAESVTIGLSTGDVFTLPTDNYPQRAFAGFISSSGDITSLTFSAPSTDSTADVNLDNFVFGQGGSVIPEPTSLTLLGLGFVGLAGHRWFRRRRIA